MAPTGDHQDEELDLALLGRREIMTAASTSDVEEGANGHEEKVFEDTSVNVQQSLWVCTLVGHGWWRHVWSEAEMQKEASNNVRK